MGWASAVVEVLRIICFAAFLISVIFLTTSGSSMQAMNSAEGQARP